MAIPEEVKHGGLLLTHQSQKLEVYITFVCPHFLVLEAQRGESVSNGAFVSGWGLWALHLWCDQAVVPMGKGGGRDAEGVPALPLLFLFTSAANCIQTLILRERSGNKFVSNAEYLKFLGSQLAWTNNTHSFLLTLFFYCVTSVEFQK